MKSVHDYITLLFQNDRAEDKAQICTRENDAPQEPDITTSSCSKLSSDDISQWFLDYHRQKQISEGEFDLEEEEDGDTGRKFERLIEEAREGREKEEGEGADGGSVEESKKDAPLHITMVTQVSLIQP